MYSEVDRAIDLIGEIEIPNGEEDLFVLRRRGYVPNQVYPFNLVAGDSPIDELNWYQARFLAQEISKIAKKDYDAEYGLITPKRISKEFEEDDKFKWMMLFNNVYNGCYRVYDEENSKIYDFFNPEIRIIDWEFRVDPLEKLLEKQEPALIKDLDKEPNRKIGTGSCRRNIENDNLECYFLSPDSNLRETIAVLEKIE